MRLRTASVAAAILLLLAASAAWSADSVFVRNRTFADHFNDGGTTYVNLEAFLKAVGYKWDLSPGGSVMLSRTRGSNPAITAETVELDVEGSTHQLATYVRGEGRYAELRPLAEALGLRVIANEQTGIIDVVKGRDITERDRQLAEEVARAREEERRKVAEAWERKREEIVARRKAKEEEEARRQAEEGGGPPPEGQGGPPPEGQGGPPPEEQGGPPPEEAAPPAEGGGETAARGAEEKPAAEPKPEPEAKLLTVRPRALPDYFTGRVAMTAEVRNNGYATAKNIKAHLTLKGPDGSVWNEQNLYRDQLAEDATWTLEASWTHLEGASMPRGVPTLVVELDYDKN